MKNEQRKMKNSGIEWIGEIPNDWNKIYGQYLYDIVTGKKDVNQGDLDGQYPFFTCSDDVKRINEYSFDCEALLVAGNGIVGNTKYYNGKFDAYQRTYVLYNFKKERINIEFLKIYLSNLLTISVETKTSGSVIEFIKLGDIKKFEIVYPDINRQERIAELLNKKIHNINSLIMNEEQQIEKLKEYKQSLITEVVTKGLDKNVEMKDSGVEWIGKIPNHWKIVRIKNAFTLNNERTNETDLEKVNLISLYTDKGVIQHSDLIETTGNKAITAEGYKIVKKKDIVVNIILCWMGAIGMSEYDGVTSPAYDIYTPKNHVVSKYYHYLFRTSNFNGECFRYGRGIMLMRWRTYSTEFTSIHIPYPNLKEQERIVEYLDVKCNDVDKLIDVKQKRIEKLNEYKKSLIYEYVTGKKEV